MAALVPARLRRRSVPPCEGTPTTGGAFLEGLQGLATGGMTPRRRQIEAELSPLPLAFFEAPIALPAGWCQGGAAFLLLNEFYRPDASRAGHSAGLSSSARQRIATW